MSMLPFLKKGMSESIISKRVGKPGAEVAAEVKAPGSSEDSYDLESCMGDLLGAIQRKSPMDMAKEFKKAFEALESEPHEEAGEENV